MGDFFDDVNSWLCSRIKHPFYSSNLEKIKKYFKDHPDEINTNQYVHQTFGLDIHRDQEADNHITPIMHACRHARCDVFDFFLEAGAYVNLIDDHDYTLLHHVCDFYFPNNRYIIQKLISLDLESIGLQKNKNGFTPLHSYLSGEEVEIETINLLLPVSDPNCTSNHGETCLMTVCATNQKPEVINLIIDFSNDINQQDDRGNTALHYCCIYRASFETIKLLIDRGADPNIPNEKGHIPLMSLCEYGASEKRLPIGRFLFDHIKNPPVFTDRFYIWCTSDNEFLNKAIAKGLLPPNTTLNPRRYF